MFRRFAIRIILGALNGTIGSLEFITRWRGEDTTPARILVLRTGALGDFLFSIPAFKQIRQAFPAAKIILLTTATTQKESLETVTAYSNGGSPWLRLLPNGLFDEIRLINVSSWENILFHGRREISSGGFDCCFNVYEGIALALSSPLKRLLYLRMQGLTCRIYGLTTHAYPRIFPGVQRISGGLEHHVTALLRSTEECPEVRRTGRPTEYYGLKAPPDALQWASNRLQLIKNSINGVIVIAPGSRLEFKKWPADNYIKLIKYLMLDTRLSVILVGSGPEKADANTVESKLGSLAGARVHNLAGETDLTQLSALLSLASVFIGNDGGTCHLAAAFGCRVVSIANGAEVPNSVEPWGNQRFTARHKVTCSPCYSFESCPKGTSECVTGIRVEKVLELTFAALSEARASLPVGGL